MQTKGLIGTLSYMAPELLSHFCCAKSDVWSAGVVFYILLTGKSPFRKKVREETMDNIKNK